MKYYTVRSDGAYVSFFGMSQETINEMLVSQGMTCTYITEEEYNTYIEAHSTI